MDRFARDLARIARTSIAVPPEVDRAIRDAARTRLSQGTRPAGRHRALGWTAAAAAAVAIATWLTVRPFSSPSGGFGDRADLDGNGRVDILDAFALARHLEAGDPPPGGTGDFSGDGLVDADDVEFLAQRTVRLDAEGAS